MAIITRARRLVNPARKKRLTARQKLFFGTKRQRTAAKASLRKRRKNVSGVIVGRRVNPNSRKRRHNVAAGFYDEDGYFHPIRASYDYSNKRAGEGSKRTSKAKKRRVNPSRRSTKAQRLARAKRQRSEAQRVNAHIEKLERAEFYRRGNPSRKRRKNSLESKIEKLLGVKGIKMAKSRRRRRRVNVSHRRRRRSNPVARVHRRRRAVVHHRRRQRRSNPGVVVRYRNRGRVRHHHRRRNPGGRSFFSGSFGKVAGVLGGAAVTGVLTKMVPASINTGIMGYVSTGVVAFLQGKIVGKVFKNASLGNDMVVGGLVYLGLRILSDMFPSLAAYIPFSMNGMGLITSSNFYTPQVPLPGSMASFVRPAGVPAAVIMPAASGMHGVVTNSAGSRLSMRRMGRAA